MSSLDKILIARTAEEVNGLFGVFVKVVNAAGETLYSKGAGRVHFDNDTVPDENTAYWAFSWTKLLTTIAALQCVERDQISLDEDVSAVVPELKDLQIISAGPDGQGFTLRPATKKITLRHLLTHQSGFSYDARDPLLLQWRKSRGEGPLGFCGDVVKAFSIPLLFEPGESWCYGGSLDWAGQVIERLNKVSLGEYMERNIFAPLGMTSTTFEVDSIPGLKERIMDIPMRLPDGKLVPTKCWYPADALTHSGGVGIVTTVGDYTNVLQDLLREEPVILSLSSVDAMFTPQFEKTGKQAVGLMSQPWMHETLTGGEKTLGKLSFGMGGLLTLEPTALLPSNTLTWGAMPCMEWFVNREKGIAGAFGNQMMPPGDPHADAVIQTFIEEAMKFAK